MYLTDAVVFFPPDVAELFLSEYVISECVVVCYLVYSLASPVQSNAGYFFGQQYKKTSNKNKPWS